MPAALTNKFLRDQWCEVISECTHLPLDRVIWETWSDRRPMPGSYITLYLVNRQFAQSNIPGYATIDGVYKEILINPVEDTLRISALGADALDLLTRTAAQLSSGDRWFDLWPYIGKGKQGVIRDTSLVWQGQFHQRWQMDLNYFAALTSPSKRGPDNTGNMEEYPFIKTASAEIIWYSLDGEKVKKTVEIKMEG